MIIISFFGQGIGFFIFHETRISHRGEHNNVLYKGWKPRVCSLQIK